MKVTNTRCPIKSKCHPWTDSRNLTRETKTLPTVPQERGGGLETKEVIYLNNGRQRKENGVKMQTLKYWQISFIPNIYIYSKYIFSLAKAVY